MPRRPSEQVGSGDDEAQRAAQEAEAAIADQERRQAEAQAQIDVALEKSMEGTGAASGGAVGRPGDEGAPDVGVDRAAQDAAGAADDDRAEERAAERAAAERENRRYLEAAQEAVTGLVDAARTEAAAAREAQEKAAEGDDPGALAVASATLLAATAALEALEALAANPPSVFALPASTVLPDIQTATGTYGGGTQKMATYGALRTEWATLTMPQKAATIAGYYANAVDPLLGQVGQAALSVKAVTIPTPSAPDTTVVKA